MDVAERVLDVVLPADYEKAELVHPGRGALHLPGPVVAAQPAPMGYDACRNRTGSPAPW